MEERDNAEDSARDLTVNDYPEWARDNLGMGTCKECGSVCEYGYGLCMDCEWARDGTIRDAAEDDQRARLSQGAR